MVLLVRLYLLRKSVYNKRDQVAVLVVLSRCSPLRSVISDELFNFSCPVLLEFESFAVGCEPSSPTKPPPLDSLGAPTRLYSTLRFAPTRLLLNRNRPKALKR